MVDTRGPEQPPSWGGSGRVTAIATVLGAVVAVLAFLYGDDVLCRLGSESRRCLAPPTPAPPIYTSPIPTPQDESGPSPTQPQPPTRKDTVRWTGQFLLRSINGAELDTVPPSPATGPADNLDQGDLFYDNREALGNWLYAGAIPIALWESSEKPTARACADAITTVGFGKVRPEPGMVLCVATTGRRIAALEIVRAEYGGVLFNVTVWG